MPHCGGRQHSLRFLEVVMWNCGIDIITVSGSVCWAIVQRRNLQGIVRSIMSVYGKRQHVVVHRFVQASLVKNVVHFG
jgi:hypothetical protein